MKYLYEHWYKSTLFLAILVFLLSIVFVLQKDVALFLICLQTAIYLLHQFEEYILPGGFVAFFNTKVLGSNETEFPLDKKASFWINIPIIFIGFPLSAILANCIDLSFGIWTAYFSVINALSHVGMFLKHKCSYNPGLFVSLLLNIPFGIGTIYYFNANNLVSLKVNLISVLIGLSIQGGLMVYGFRILKPRIGSSLGSTSETRGA